MSAWRRPLTIVLAGLTLALGIVVLRLVVDARAAFRAGVVAEQQGDLRAATRHYLDAGRLYVPGSPYTRHALDRLDALAVAAVSSGDYATARSAFEAERAAILATRSFYTPYAERLPEVERRLSRLLAATEEYGAAESFPERAAWHAQLLAERPGPKASWVLLALVGLALWVGSAAQFFRRGLDSQLRLRRPQAILAASGFILGLTLFLACLRLA